MMLLTTTDTGISSSTARSASTAGSDCGSHFLSVSSTCEDIGSVEEHIGWISPNRGGETLRALRRCSRNDHRHTDQQQQQQQQDQSSIDKVLALTTPQEESAVFSSSSAKMAATTTSASPSPSSFYYYHALDLPCLETIEDTTASSSSSLSDQSTSTGGVLLGYVR